MRKVSLLKLLTKVQVTNFEKKNLKKLDRTEYTFYYLNMQEHLFYLFK